MGLTKQYLRYVPAGICNVIGSQLSNIVYLDDRRCIVGACENVYVWALRIQEKVIVLHGEQSFVSIVRVSSDRKRVAVGYEDGAIKIFELKSPDAPKVVLQGHKNAVTCMNFNDDGLVLASGGKDGVVILWDLVNESGLFRLIGHKGAVTQCRFVRSKQVLITSSKDTLVKFWDLTSQHCFYTLADHRGEVWDFVMTKDDTQLVTGSVENELRIYEIVWLNDGADEDKKPENYLDTDVKRLRLVDADGEESTDNSQANNILRCKKFGTVLRQGEGRVTQLSVSNDGKLLLCLGTKYTLDAYKICTIAEVKRRITKKLRKARKKAGESQAETTEELEQLVETDISTQYLHLGEFKAEAKIRSVESRCLDASMNTYKLLFLLDNNTISELLFEVGEKSIQRMANRPDMSTELRISACGHSTDVRAMAFSHDNSAFLSASKDSAKIWNRHSLACIRSLPCKDAIGAAFVTGDQHCIIASKSGSLTLHDVARNEIVEEVPAHGGCVWSLCLTPDEKGFVSGSADKSVKFWNFELVTQENNKKALTLAHTRTLKVDDEVLCVKISANYKYVVVGLLDNTAKVFFVDSFKFYLSLYGHSLPVLCVDISLDNSLIVTGSADKNVKIWGMDFGDCHRSLFAHDDSVTCVQFVHKTHLFFSAGRDGKIKQWDADKFERIFVLDGHQKEIWALAISSNGNFLVSSAHDRAIRLWEKSEEIVVLEEEKENEREREHEKALEQTEDVVPGNVTSEAALASRKTLDTVRAAEQIIEALDVCREEKAKDLAEPDQARRPHPLMIAYGSRNLHEFVADILRRVRSNDLEKALLMVPFGYVMELMGYLTDCLDGNYEVELVTRCSCFLLRVHHGHIVNSSTGPAVVDRLRKSSKQAISEARDIVGFNISALKFLQLELAEKEQVQLFAEARERIKDKRRRKKGGQARASDKAYVVSLS